MSQASASESHDANTMDLGEDHATSPGSSSPSSSASASQDAASPPPFEAEELPPTAPSVLPEGGMSTISGAPTDLTAGITSAFNTNLLSTGERVEISPAAYLPTLESNLTALRASLSMPLPESSFEKLQELVKDLEEHRESE